MRVHAIIARVRAPLASATVAVGTNLGVASVEGLCASNDDAASCMDCVLANWDEISNSLNCTIADAGYHCTGY